MKIILPEASSGPQQRQIDVNNGINIMTSTYSANSRGDLRSCNDENIIIDAS